MHPWPARRVTKPWVWYALVGGVMLVQMGMAFVMTVVPEARAIGEGPQFLLPGLFVGALGYMVWRSIHPPTVMLRHDGRWLVVEAKGRVARFDLAGARVGYARWSYAATGTMGTIVELRAPEGTLRFAIRKLLPDGGYDLPDSYTYDLHFEHDAVGEQVLAAVRHLSGANAPADVYRGHQAAPVFVIPLLPNQAKASVPIVVGSFGMPVVLSLTIVPLANGITVVNVLASAAGVLLGVGLVGFLLWRRREGRRYQLRLAEGQIMLEDRYAQSVVAQAAPGQLRVTRTYYKMRIRSGSWDIPSLAIAMPGFDDELTIAGGGAQDAGWIGRATESKTARYTIGAAEWDQLLHALQIGSTAAPIVMQPAAQY